MNNAANYTPVDFDTAYQVLLRSEVNDDYMGLCVDYEHGSKSAELRQEIVFRYNVAKQWDATSEKGESVPLIKCYWHAKYIIKVFGMFMDKPEFGDIPMRCLVTGKTAEELAEDDRRQAEEQRIQAEARRKQVEAWTAQGLCPNCGGTIKSGLFGKKCTKCGQKQ